MMSSQDYAASPGSVSGREANMQFDDTHGRFLNLEGDFGEAEPPRQGPVLSASSSSWCTVPPDVSASPFRGRNSNNNLAMNMSHRSSVLSLGPQQSMDMGPPGGPSSAARKRSSEGVTLEVAADPFGSAAQQRKTLAGLFPPMHQSYSLLRGL